MAWLVKHPAYKSHVFVDRASAEAYIDTICDYLARREDVEMTEVEENDDEL